jgi:prevent-host-death family protein
MSSFDIYAIILYMTTLPLADVRAQLSKLVEEASSTHQKIEITKNGHRAAVLLGADDYDSMLETIAVLSDSALLSDHEHGLKEIEAGNALTMDELAREMNDAGRRVEPR